MGKMYFEVGKEYRTRRGSYVVIEVDEKRNKIKIRETNGEEKWEDDLKLLERIHRAIQEEENRVILVCHHKECWNRDNRMIGFRRKPQWDILKVNNKIIYFRHGENRIKGIFKIIEKGQNLNPSFSDIPGISEPLIHQCRLELITDDITCSHPEEIEDLFNNLLEEGWGSRQIQVFQVSREHLRLILSDPSVVKFMD